MSKREAGPLSPATPQNHPQRSAPLSSRWRSSWGVDYATAKRYGYPIRRITLLEELELRVDAIEAAIAVGTVVDLDGAS